MKKIALLNTSVSSFNMGDYIIVESIKRELKEILKENMVIEFSTHSPAFRFFAAFHLPFGKNKFRKELKSFDYRFVCGTNLLEKNMFRRQASWNIKLLESRIQNECIFVGVGAGTIGKINLYTKIILKNSLSSKYIHSVRDEEAKKMLDSIGIKSINTGCPTMWCLNKEHCELIPTNKSNKVVFTLTDYCKDLKNDKMMVEILLKNYKEVYFWIQGFEDLEYLKSITNIENIKLIYPQLTNYNDFLDNNECDYVGTRLHAGVKAMQKFKRSIIVIVDNRARSIKRDNNIVGIERDNIESLEELINSSFKTKIKINEKNIDEWKAQFINGDK